MKTAHILLLFACFISGTLLAQPQKYIRNFDDDVYGIYPCKDSSYYTISIHPGCGINSFAVRYMNRKGEVVWAKESPLSVAHFTHFEGVVQDNNSFTIAYYTGGYNLITQITSTGDVQFSHCFNPNGYKFTKIMAINNEFYVTGNKETPNFADSSKAVLVKLNSSGNFQWAKTYQFPGYKHFMFNDAKVHNGSLLVGGHFSDGNSPEPSYPYIAKLDLNGNLSQQYTYVIDSNMFLFEPYKLTAIDFYDDNALFGRFRASSGVDCIMRLDEQFNMVWTKNIIGTLGLICASYEGGVYFTTEGQLYGDVYKMDPTGAITHHYAHNLSSSEYGQATVMKRHDCGYMIATSVGWPSDLYAHIPSDGGYCGGVTDALDNTYDEPVIRRAVSATAPVSATFTYFTSGNAFTVITPVNDLFCSETFQCSGSLDVSENELHQFNLFPNPATDHVQLELPAGTAVEVIDELGKVILMTTDLNGELRVSELAAGVYTLRAGNAVSRLVKE
jgi:Secretion system C-terminal sorting domain